MEFPTKKERNVFCNRTLNLRSIRAIGYDMDYTLVHYHVKDWEERAYQHLKSELLKKGWPVTKLEFNPEEVQRGLIIDTELGNILKVNRFGFIKKGRHGTQPMDFDTHRSLYSRTIVDLAEKRWVFLNTLFSLSEGCMYAQLIDLLDQNQIPRPVGQSFGYKELYEVVRKTLEAAHMEKAHAHYELRVELYLRNDEL
jgi:5'-nucleotidase